MSLPVPPRRPINPHLVREMPDEAHEALRLHVTELIDRLDELEDRVTALESPPSP